MITKQYGLDDVNDAYADLLNGEIILGGYRFRKRLNGTSSTRQA